MVVLAISCKTGSNLFGKQSPHEKYGNKIKEAGLAETSLGRLWFSKAAKALQQPAKVTLPYKEIGYFPADNPRATGLQFAAKRGQKLIFSLDVNPRDSFLLFVDLWRIETDTSLLFSADSSQTSFEYTVDEDGDYLLRLQPELLKSGDYAVSISVGPSLSSPVAGNKGRIGSIWGDDRDAGARSHEGIDIFAPFRTPAIAATDGTVTAVNENNLGGKVVWLRPKGKRLSLYYAHLDEQLVTGGQKVKKGDTLGLIGNTGNARTTPPHLHFGIYATGGAINPLPFVDPDIKNPPSISGSANDLTAKLRLARSEKVLMGESSVTLKPYTILEPVAVTPAGYRVELDNGQSVIIPKKNVQTLKGELKTAYAKNDGYLYDAPKFLASRISAVKQKTSLEIYGYANNFSFVQLDNTRGWLPDSLLSK